MPIANLTSLCLSTFALLLFGCAPARPVPVTAAPTPSPTPCAEPASGFDLSGSWMTGVDTPEPALPEIVIHVECAHHPAAWLLQQRGNELEAWQFEARMDQGVASKQPVARIAPERGRVCGPDVTIGLHQLQYDAASGHLRGTREGKTFWAIRQRVIRPSPCPGIP